ncbi:MAG: hypothetical protein M1419_07950 [Bacteroidetes bacterium]|nr:hypothetical protein [Bacteroidota bacterium]
MKSITIHKIDDSLFSVLKQKAVKSGRSMNQIIKQILSDSLGSKKKVAEQSEFKEFLGVWSKNDFKVFSSNTKDLSTINPDDWK